MTTRIERLLLGPLGALGALAACDDGRGALTLVFPNEPARAAVRRLRVDFRTSRVTNPCRSMLARSEIVPVDSAIFEANCPVDESGACAEGWLDDLNIPVVEPDASAVEVRGYFDEDPEAWPVVAGCQDGFDPERPDLRVELGVYIRRESPVQLVAGHAAVGPPGSESARPLSARVRSFPRDGSARSFFDVAGATIRFEVVDGDLEFDDGSTVRDVVAGPDGVASVGYRRGAVGTHEVRISVPFEEDDPEPGPPVSAFISAVPDVALDVGPAIPALEGRAIDVSIGDADANGVIDAFVLGCTGDAPCAPTDGSRPDDAFGETELRIVFDVTGAAARAREPALGLGWAPVGIASSRFIVPGGGFAEEVVIAEARNRDCRPVDCDSGGPCTCRRVGDGAPCRCEAGVVHVRRWDEGRWTTPFEPSPEPRSDNVIGMELVRGVPFPSELPPFDGVALATRGRIGHGQPCAAATACPEDCPDRETCGITSGRLRCLPSPPSAQVFSLRADGWDDLASCGCASGTLGCAVGGMFDGLCPDDGAGWRTTDVCGEQRLARVEAAPGVVPRSFALDAIRTEGAVDLLFGSDRAIELVSVRADGPGAPQSILLETRVDGVLGVYLDFMIDRLVPLPPLERDRLRGDLVWWSEAPCDVAAERCPAVYASSTARGCVGVAVTAGRPDVASLDYADARHCRRMDLPIVPDHGCWGDFNRDGDFDLLFAEEGGSELAFLFGDDHGGLSVPARTVPLPTGTTGGPLTCVDVDRDGRREVVMVGAETGAVHVLRTEPR
jgi:hypothetical protein